MNQISDSFNGLMKEISERRSVRRYTDASVDDQLLNRLLEVAGHTQTMGNLQLYSVVVTRSEEKKRQLAPAHFNQPMVTQAPVVLTFCADYCRTTAWWADSTSGRNASTAPAGRNWAAFSDSKRILFAIIYTDDFVLFLIFSTKLRQGVEKTKYFPFFYH